jgi:hypothetical protein
MVLDSQGTPLLFAWRLAAMLDCVANDFVSANFEHPKIFGLRIYSSCCIRDTNKSQFPASMSRGLLPIPLAAYLFFCKTCKCLTASPSYE